MVTRNHVFNIFDLGLIFFRENIISIRAWGRRRRKISLKNKVGVLEIIKAPGSIVREGEVQSKIIPVGEGGLQIRHHAVGRYLNRRIVNCGQNIMKQNFKCNIGTAGEMDRACGLSTGPQICG